MAAEPDKKPEGPAPGLSLKTLLISAASAVAAAVLVPLVWEKGTLVATALTPIVVAVVNNLLQRPVDKVSSIRVLRTEDEEAGDGSEQPTVLIVPESTEPLPEEEPTLILPAGVDVEQSTKPLEEVDEDAGWRERIAANLPNFRGRRARIVLATGLLGFLLGGTFITVSELVGGGSVSLSKRTTLLPGSVDTTDLDEDPTPTPTATGTATPSTTASPSETASPGGTTEPDESPSPSPTPADDEEDGNDRASPTPTRTGTPEATPSATTTPTASPTPAP